MPVPTQQGEAAQKTQPWKAVQIMRAGVEKNDKVEQVGVLGSVRTERGTAGRGGSLGG